ncbi:hypothetical protein, partial [Streptomyces clavifer]
MERSGAAIGSSRSSGRLERGGGPRADGAGQRGGAARRGRLAEGTMALIDDTVVRETLFPAR